MPGRKGTIHQVGRRRAIPRIQADGRWFGMGPQADDVISGWKFPKRQMTRQRSGLVSYKISDGSIDFPPEY